jgi:hypothetical protein
MSDKPLPQFDESIRRFVYKKLGFDEHDDTFFCDYYRELCRAHASGDQDAEKRLSSLLTHSATVNASLCVRMLTSGAVFFQNQHKS